MGCIWYGNITRIADFLKFEAILDNLHSWAMRVLRPCISAYIDQWSERYPQIVAPVIRDLDKSDRAVRLLVAAVEKLSIALTMAGAESQNNKDALVTESRLRRILAEERKTLLQEMLGRWGQDYHDHGSKVHSPDWSDRKPKDLNESELDDATPVDTPSKPPRKFGAWSSPPSHDGDTDTRQLLEALSPADAGREASLGASPGVGSKAEACENGSYSGADLEDSTEAFDLQTAPLLKETTPKMPGSPGPEEPAPTITPDVAKARQVGDPTSTVSSPAPFRSSPVVPFVFSANPNPLTAEFNKGFDASSIDFSFALGDPKIGSVSRRLFVAKDK